MSFPSLWNSTEKTSVDGQTVLVLAQPVLTLNTATKKSWSNAMDKLKKILFFIFYIFYLIFFIFPFYVIPIPVVSKVFANGKGLNNALVPRRTRNTFFILFLPENSFRSPHKIRYENRRHRPPRTDPVFFSSPTVAERCMATRLEDEASVNKRKV